MLEVLLYINNSKLLDRGNRYVFFMVVLLAVIIELVHRHYECC